MIKDNCFTNTETTESHSIIGVNLDMNYPSKTDNDISIITQSNKDNNKPKPITKKTYHQESPLLPPLKPAEMNNTKTLLLELDKTLTYSTLTKMPIESDITLHIDLESQPKELYVFNRPHLSNFLNRVSQHYEVVIFTSRPYQYANNIIQAIDSNRLCRYRLFREHCTFINNSYIKQLKRLNRNMKNVILLDHDLVSYSYDEDNGIPIKAFLGDGNDNELIQMAYILEKLAKVTDVRYYIKSIVYYNQIDYDKAFELFKNKEKHDDMFEHDKKSLLSLANQDDCCTSVVNNNNIKLHRDDDNKDNKRRHVKIVSVEKIDSKVSSKGMLLSNDGSKSSNDINFKPVDTTTNTHKDKSESSPTSNRKLTANFSGVLFHSYEYKNILNESNKGDENNHHDNKEACPAPKCKMNQTIKEHKQILPKGKIPNLSIDSMSKAFKAKSISMNKVSLSPNKYMPIALETELHRKPSTIKSSSKKIMTKKKSSDIMVTNTGKNTLLTKRTIPHCNNNRKLFEINYQCLKIRKQNAKEFFENVPTSVSPPKTERQRPFEDIQISLNSKYSLQKRSIDQQLHNNNTSTTNTINKISSSSNIKIKNQSRNESEMLRIVYNRSKPNFNRTHTHMSADKYNNNTMSSNNK